jgi:flagellum-specific ATP synthase
MSATGSAETLRAELEAARARALEAAVVRRSGRVTKALGLAIESSGPRAAVGEECRFETRDGTLRGLGEIVGFDGSTVFSVPVDPLRGLHAGDHVVATGRVPTVPVGEALLGRVLDANGQPIDGGGPLGGTIPWQVDGDPVPALSRPRIDTPMPTGIRAIDGCLTFGRGQRIGIFSGAGVGKSRLLGALARLAGDEVVVISLVGERNREVRDFVEGELGPEGAKRAVVYVATSDESPLRRVRCAMSATAAAEAFRRAGHNVTLLMDSLTRVAMAVREIGLAAGEPPTSKAYTPSVFSFLPRLLERAGREKDAGAMTAVYTVFVEGDDLSDPVADAARAILDGHVLLSRNLAERGHYPAIDVLGSVSRVMGQVVQPEHAEAAARLRRLLATHEENRDLLAIGAYREGSDPEVDRAVHWRPRIDGFLQQDLGRATALEETRAMLARIGAEES